MRRISHHHTAVVVVVVVVVGPPSFQIELANLQKELGRVFLDHEDLLISEK